MTSELQSILIDKSKFTLYQAKRWITMHGFKIKKVDITDRFYRFRQNPPSKYKSFRTINLSNGIKAILGIFL